MKIIKLSKLLLVLSLICNGAQATTIVKDVAEARLSNYLKTSSAAEVYLIKSASYCGDKDPLCSRQYRYEVKRVETAYGQGVETKLFSSDFEISVGSYALIFSEVLVGSKGKKIVYYNRFYELKKKVETASNGRLGIVFFVDVGTSPLIEDIPSLELPTQEISKICVSGKCKDYGAGIFIRYSDFLKAMSSYRKKS